MKNIKIKGTDLDRTRKVDNNKKHIILNLRKQNLTYDNIAKILGLSNTCIRYHCLSQKEKAIYLSESRERKKTWYYNLNDIQRKIFANKWKDSHKKYIEELYNTKLNNM